MCLFRTRQLLELFTSPEIIYNSDRTPDIYNKLGTSFKYVQDTKISSK